MNFHDTTLSAIVATLIAAGLIAIASYLWKKREYLLNKWLSFFKKDKHVSISFEDYAKGFKTWKSDICINITVHQWMIKKDDFPTTYYNVVGVDLAKGKEGVHEVILTIVDKQKKLLVVSDNGLKKIIRQLYYWEVINA